MGLQSLHTLYRLEDRDQAEALIVEKVSGVVRQAVEERGQASLMLSGGGTPRAVYAQLSQVELPWDKVRLGLVDERWVAPDHEASNEKMIRGTILQNKAAHARFLGMKLPNDDANSAVPALNAQYAAFNRPFDLCLMGMGTDGHTASWFPGSADLDRALSIDNPDMVCAVDATGSPGAGNHPSRMTLTLPAVMESRNIFLFITGEEKSEVFRAAMESSVDTKPVKALLAAGSRLSVFWAP